MEEDKKEVLYCKRCGRKLKSPEAKQRGMGKVCWEKSQHDPTKRLFYQKESAKHEDNDG